MLSSKTSKMFRNQKGLTLVELMIAVFILALIAMGLFQAFTAAFQTMNDAKERTIATNYAQQILENFKNTNFKKIESIPFSPIEGTKYFQYAIVEKIDENLKKVTAQISWAGMNNSEKKIFVDTLINNEQSIAEIGAVPAGIVIYAYPYNLLPVTDERNQDKRSHIWAEVVDKNGDLIVDWEGVVSFDIESATDLENEEIGKYVLGYLNPDKSTIEQGIAETYFEQTESAEEEEEGYITIKASLIIEGNDDEIYDTLTIRVTNDAVSVILESDKYTIRTVGGGEEDSIAHLTAKIVDPAGDIVTTGKRKITFDIVSGPETSNLINYEEYIDEGIAKIDLKAGSMPGINTVVATALLLEPGIINIEVVDPGAHYITIKAANTRIVQQGSTEIIATLKDYMRNPVRGETINFEITSFEPDNTLGFLSTGSATTDSKGGASTILTMNYAGKATIRAWWKDEEDEEGDVISASMIIECRNHSLYVDADSTTVQAGGSVEISAELLNSDGEPVPSQLINFFIKETDGNASLLPASNNTDEDGMAYVTLTVNDGTYVIVEGKWAGDPDTVLDNVEIECTSAPVYEVVLSAVTSISVSHQPLPITATVKKNGIPTEDIEVTFELEGSSNAKIEDGESPYITNSNGEVIVYLSGLGPGESVTITAYAEDASDSITIICETLPILIELADPPDIHYGTGNNYSQVYFSIIVRNGDIDLKQMKISWVKSTGSQRLQKLLINDDEVYNGDAKSGTTITFNQSPYYFTLEEDKSYIIKMIFKNNVKDKDWTIIFINPDTEVGIDPPIVFGKNDF